MPDGAAAAALALVIGLGIPFSAGAEDGREIFIAYECNSCHSIEAAGIHKSEAPAEPDEGFDGFDDFGGEDETEPPDLSDVGSRRDREWMREFLRKKLANENGRKHRKRFKGSDAEFDALLQFLAGLDGRGTAAAEEASR